MAPTTPMQRARWRCSARSTATRCASCRWAMPTRQRATRLLGRAVRRHARARAPATSASSGSSRESGDRVRRAPHRGAHRRRRAATSPTQEAPQGGRPRRSSAPEEVADRVNALVEERKRLERELADAKKQLAMGGGGKDGGAGHLDVGGRKFLAAVSGVAMKDLRPWPTTASQDRLRRRRHRQQSADGKPASSSA